MKRNTIIVSSLTTLTFSAVGAFGLLGATSAQAAGKAETPITGQGSSFVANFLDQCKADAKNSKGLNVTYQPTGSGAGRQGYLNGSVDFAGSDVPFSATEAEKAKEKPFVYVPVVAGGIALVYNVPGVKNVVLPGPVIAKIFAGKILMWNDKAIVAANKKAKLPKLVIRVVVRSDSSGTSAVFSNYLNAVDPVSFPKGGLSNFPVPKTVGIGQKGSDGIANYVAGSQGKGAIGYAEVSFATERKLSVASTINAAGKTVSPTSAAVSAALETAPVNPDGTITIDHLTKTPTAYPISTTSYVIAAKDGDADKRAAVAAFLTEVVGPCQTKAAGLGYAQLPATLAAAVNKTVAALAGP
jgi:phosphate transport system substrate-binding protein